MTAEADLEFFEDEAGWMWFDCLDLPHVPQNKYFEGFALLHLLQFHTAGLVDGVADVKRRPQIPQNLNFASETWPQLRHARYPAATWTVAEPEAGTNVDA